MSNLVEEDIGQLRDVFEYFDIKQSGFISSKQLGITLRCLQPKPLDIDIEDMMQTVVKECNDKINFEDFLNKVCEVIEIAHIRKQNKSHRASCYKNLSEANIQELKDSFGMFDTNGDGTISIHEMSVVMESLGHHATEEEIKKMMRDVQTKESSGIDFEEFIILMTRKKSADDLTAELKEAFDYFDKDGDGSISSEELQTIMSKFGENLTSEELEEMMKEADANGDGKVDYAEFVKMMNFFNN
ncbi:calmodulin isoform X1 [Hydra vulgaris]|uniref:Calmodulin isoform X1 n=2 Tax=Hydra vulgaris TaxID=6087 RepID=A0ABM4CN63_HYDVU